MLTCDAVRPVARNVCHGAVLSPGTSLVRLLSLVCFLWRCDPMRAMASFLRFLDHTQRRITVGRTPLNKWSARRRDFYLTTHNTHNRQTSMPPVGFEPTISASEQPQNYALDRAATGTGLLSPGYPNSEECSSSSIWDVNNIFNFLYICILNYLNYAITRIFFTEYWLSWKPHVTHACS